MSQWIIRFPRPSGCVAVLAMLFAAAPARACLVCTEQPERTLADRIWAADAVVLARNTPQDPYAYASSQTRAGAAAAPIEFVVNSVERLRMAADPDRVALFLLEPRGWSMSGHGGADFAILIDDVLAHETRWTDAWPDPDRIAYFAALHAHPDPLIRRTALTELSRLPYSLLRDIEIALEPDWITARLSDASWFGWWPVLAHMSGLHSDPNMHEIVRARARDASPATRGPWLVAQIEVDGAEAVAAILSRVETDEDALEATRALVTHADAESEIAPEIAAALRQLAKRGPVVAAQATVGLHALGDWSLAPLVLDLLGRDRVSDPATDYALKRYVAQSRSFTARAASPLDLLPERDSN